MIGYKFAEWCTVHSSRVLSVLYIIWRIPMLLLKKKRNLLIYFTKTYSIDTKTKTKRSFTSADHFYILYTSLSSECHNDEGKCECARALCAFNQWLSTQQFDIQGHQCFFHMHKTIWLYVWVHLPIRLYVSQLQFKCVGFTMAQSFKVPKFQSGGHS